MSERGSMCVLRACVVGAVAAACAASAGAAAATEGCTPKPAGPASQGQHWYYVLDRVAKRQCWHLGPLGVAARRSAMLRARHRGPPRETAAAAATDSHAAMTEPAETTALPPAPLAQIMDASPPSEAAAPSARATRAAAGVAPAGGQAEAPRPAAITRSAAADETDHGFALIVLAAALLMIVGPVLALMRWWSGRKIRAKGAAAVPVRHAAPVVVRTAATRQRTPLAPDQPEDIGESLRRLLDEALPKEYPRASTPAST